ncbi:protein takeout-like [Ischnura elegans]|uniref:protein takeout-like n=1 Tax=Ischnura elegans TaxID=197161 RepID=UPI001ED8AF64|nr:protein takeout-like [Ischnura elegans]
MLQRIKMNLFVLCLFAGIAVVTSQENEQAIETPEYILPCRRVDKDLNNCIKNTFNHLRPYLVKGIPELEMPPIEPLKIDVLAMENGHGPVNVRAVFTNLTVHGASNYSVVAVKSDLATYRLDLGMKIPVITATGRYEVTGNVLLLPVRSKGDFLSQFTDVTALAKIYGKEEKEAFGRKGPFMRTDKLVVDFALGKARFRVRDLLNGDSLLGAAMNQFLNQNSIEIINEMKPAASASISKLFKKILNDAFLRIPIKVWLRE